MGSKKNDRFRYLRNLLEAHDIDVPYLCGLLGREYSYVNDRLRGKENCPWTQKEQYIIMEAVNEPLENLHIVFPKDGIDIMPTPQAPADITPMARALAEWILKHAQEDAQRTRTSVDPRFAAKKQRLREATP